MPEINPFNDVADNGIQKTTDFYGQDLLDNVASIKVGAGARAFKADESGIWLGANKFATAPFRVDINGNLVATSAAISGYGKNFVSTIVWTATDYNTASWSSGVIKTSDDISYSISSGNTGNINATTYIYFDPAASTTVLQTTTTAADAMGNNKILIAVIQIGISGTKCIMDIISSNGTTISGDRIVTGTITLSSDGVNLIVSSGELKLNPGADLALTGDDNNPAILKFKRSDGAEYSALKLIETWSGGVPVSSEMDIDPSGNDTMDLWIGAVNNWANIFFNTAGLVNFNCSSFTINNGTPKTAIVKTSKGYNALYTVESPNLWFVDFGKVVRNKWKFWEKPKYICDPLFLETIEGPIIITPTNDKNIVQIWGRRKGFANLRLENKTEKEFEENNKFWNTPTKNAKNN